MRRLHRDRPGRPVGRRPADPCVTGIDPDLTWDDDGTAYVTFAGFPHDIQQARVDLTTGERSRRPRRCGRAPAGSPRGTAPVPPGRHWYLLIAEGGTDRGHAVSVARGPSTTGPCEGNPANPLLTATGTQNPGRPRARRPRDRAGRQGPHGAAGGAADRLRPGYSLLGRETFLTPVDWVDGWPRADRSPRPAPGRGVTLDLTTLDDPGWLAVRRTPAEVGEVRDGRMAPGDGGLDPRTVFLGRAPAPTAHHPGDASAGRGAAPGATSCTGSRWRRGGRARTAVTATPCCPACEQPGPPTSPAGEVELRPELRRPPTGFVPVAARHGPPGRRRWRCAACSRSSTAATGPPRPPSTSPDGCGASMPPTAPSPSATSATPAPTPFPTHRRPRHDRCFPDGGPRTPCCLTQRELPVPVVGRSETRAAGVRSVLAGRCQVSRGRPRLWDARGFQGGGRADPAVILRCAVTPPGRGRGRGQRPCRPARWRPSESR